MRSDSIIGGLIVDVQHESLSMLLVDELKAFILVQRDDLLKSNLLKKAN